MPNYRAMAIAAAHRAGIDPQIFLRQINQESGFNPHAHSGAGAEGIAQFMPATAAAHHINPDNPAQALNEAAMMDAQAIKRYGGWAAALSAYNSGRPDAYKDPHFAGGQTYNYVKDILGGHNVPVGAPGPRPHGGTPLAASGGSQMGALVQQQLKRYEAAALMQNAAATAAGQSSPVSLMALVQARLQAQAAQKQFGAKPAAGVPLTKQGAAVSRTRAGGIAFIGDTSGVKGSLLSSVSQAAAAVGATKVRVTSGRRTAQSNAAAGGVQHSNHLTGDALDGEAFIPGRGWVPLGSALRGVAGKYGLRSGDVPGFFNGAPDPVHVDDGANQG